MKLQPKKNTAFAIDGKGLAPSTSPSTDFLRNIQHHSNAKDIAEMVKVHAGNCFDMTKDGKSLSLKQRQFEELGNKIFEAEAILNTLKDKLNNTKRFIRTTDLNDGQEPKNFKGWSFYEQFMFALLCILIPIILFSGAANVYANLIASGEPVFLEQPSLAIALSLIVPAGSTAIKFITNLFEYQSTKKRYALFIFALTGISLLGWSVVFSLNFTGIAGGLDLDALGESDGGKGALLVWLQLIAEILIGTALVLAAEEIYVRHNPTGETANPDYIQQEKATKASETNLDGLKVKSGELYADITQLNSKRENYIEEQTAQSQAMRARMTHFNQF